MKKVETKMIWFDARNLVNREKILPLIFNFRFEYLLVSFDLYQVIKMPRKMKLIVELNDLDNLQLISKDTIILTANSEHLQKIRSLGYKVGLLQYIENKNDMEKAWQRGSHIDFLVVEFKDETNIPLELLIAQLQSSETLILKVVTNVQDMEIAFGVMESGSDGVVLKTEDLEEILEVNGYMGKKELGRLDLVNGVVVDVQHIGMGYRSCIDSTNLLKKTEGMIIGSTSNGGLLVSSETHFLPYMELRPFRVNAGAVHSYVWCPNGMTAYLTELKAGSKILCVDVEGKTREVSVGRIKTELRPLLKIEVETEGARINAIVQDDWHIRIFGSDGQPRNASTIKIGDQLLTYVCKGGRHIGVKIDEMLEER